MGLFCPAQHKIKFIQREENFFDMSNAVIYLSVKIVTRYEVTESQINPGTIYYCTDTREAFFDENTIDRICLGTEVITVKTDSNLPSSDVAIGTFAITTVTESVYYYSDKLMWVELYTRDDMVDALGNVIRFVPHSLYKGGKLIAPRTLMSCVYDDTGLPVGEKLNYAIDWINNIECNGLDATYIRSGLLSMGVIPRAAVMDFTIVENTAGRLALTDKQVQTGDVIQEANTMKAYFVVDDSKLGTEAAFKEFTVGTVPWSGVLYRPTSIELLGGATGSASLSTGSTSSSQKIKINNIKLNVDNVESGILSVLHGGTGNQTGTAPYVKMSQADTESINLLGKRSDGTVGYSSLATVMGGVVSSSAFKATDSSVTSYLNNTSIDGKILFSYQGTSKASNGIKFTGKDGSTYNGISLYGISSSSSTQRIDVGDTSVTNLYLHAASQVTLSVDTVSFAAKDGASSHMIVSATNGISMTKDLSLYSSGISIYNSSLGKNLEVGIETVGSTYYNGKLNLSSVTAISFSNPSTNTFVFRRNSDDGKGQNIVIMNSGGVTIAGALRLSSTADLDSNLNVAGAATISGNGTIKGTASISGNTSIGGTLTLTDSSYSSTSNGKYNITGVAMNSDRLDGYHASSFVTKSELTSASYSPVIVQSSQPTGSTNKLWINSSTGVAYYWNGSAWTALSSVWKTS
jgi:hypothetical protein